MEAARAAERREGGRGRSACARLGLFVLLALGAGIRPAQADPIDLGDPTPRRIEVQFEVSSPSEPGRLDATWSPPRRAYLEPGEQAGTIRIRVPADEVEDHLRSTGTDVVKGSFSEFAWSLDPSTGHVVAADLQGRVRERIRLGPLSTAIEVAIRVEMTTRSEAGYRSTRGALGIETHDYCSPDQPLDGCVLVEARPFDPERGYVNAVGAVVAATPMHEVRAFSPLGEVRFSEPAPPPAVVSSPPPSRDAVCSQTQGVACDADHGGES